MLPFTRALCIAALISVGAGAQAPPDRIAATYRELVDDYRHRNPAAVQRLAALPALDIRLLVDSALNAPDESAPWTRDALLGAAMLHTDVCLWLLGSGHTDAAFVHLNAAIRVVEALTVRDRSSQTVVALWYRAVSAALIKSGARVWGDDLIKRSQPVLDQSVGEAAFARGLDMEIVACEVDPGVPSGAPGMRLSTPLSAASTFFEDALRQDASLHKAALHLGRSRMLLGTLADARRSLEAAAESPLASDRYLALLYLGSIEEQAGRLDEAEARYRAAVSTFPWGQSGPLALARLLGRTDRETDSRAVVAGMLERRRLADPLWTYLASPAKEPGAFLELIRAEIWQ